LCVYNFSYSYNPIFLISVYAPVNILPARGGGGHTRGFRQKTIPDRREFDKLNIRLKGGDLDKNNCLQGGDLDSKYFKMSNSPGSARRPPGRAKY